MTPRILFLVDHKQRDLPALTLISCHLQRRGIDTRLVAMGRELDVVSAFDPHAVVLPKPLYDYERLIRWKMDGRRLIVIETEGNPQDVQFELRIRVAPDLYFFWNEIMARRYRDQLERAGTTMHVSGFPRSDFLHPRLSAVFPSREELLGRYGLDASRRTLTIATCSQDAHFSEDRVRAKRKRRARSFAKSADYLDHVTNQRELLHKTVDFIREIVERYPDLNVAVKPHPNENTIFWSDFIGGLKCPRVALVVGEPINHLLRISDLHVAHNVCTTTVEALMTGLPVAEIHTARSAQMYGERHLKISTYQIRDFADLTRAIEAELAENAGLHRTEANRANLDGYVADFFSTFDGRRCEEYARQIAEWAARAVASPPPSVYWAAHPRHALLYGLVKLRRAAMRLVSGDKVRQQEEVIRNVNAPSVDASRAVKQVKGVLVDAEYGLFDNRMRSGDEQPWIERFERAGVVDRAASARA